MPIPKYEYTGPLDHTTPIDTSNARGKSVIITGGANGMGETCVRAFAAAGANVTFGDVNDRGHEIEKELNSKHSPNQTAFVKVDIRDWEQQKTMFETARQKFGSVDVVIANAGISRSSGDSLWNLDDPNSEPTKPDLNIVEVNLRGTFFTWKLAVHYFRKQPENEDRDRCFIITGSMVGWIDSPGNWEYTATKYGLRGFMRTARRSSWEQGIRINYVAPCWIKSAIRTKEYEDWLIEHGVQFGEQEDVANCMMRIATDKSVNGKSLMITPRSIAKEGFKDIDKDDYTDEDGHGGYFKKTQESQLVIIEDKWRDDYKVRVYKE
ncbi:NAD(P)-binding protein [Aaosphaeria arxii CBS 175.79]|uniref:NAD(P)-binding protein n=1 Tax=Aaosphaeria arxii CBS 175.79 TaxID=1450172 RepID=A0A6A5XI51_9PLEO|nr:NAD(P)-binding protein [Aaosphaeria arxii CBS 175.79]KAF2012450.1 NAD(P)-binding protein [Aaosphaeria arxii CBS 175.79]